MSWHATQYTDHPTYSGAFYSTYQGKAAGYYGGNSVFNGANLFFDASKSHTAYGATAYVRPRSQQTLLIIKY